MIPHSHKNSSNRPQFALANKALIATSVKMSPDPPHLLSVKRLMLERQRFDSEPERAGSD